MLLGFDSPSVQLCGPLWAEECYGNTVGCKMWVKWMNIAKARETGMLKLSTGVPIPQIGEVARLPDKTLVEVMDVIPDDMFEQTIVSRQSKAVRELREKYGLTPDQPIAPPELRIQRTVVQRAPNEKVAISTNIEMLADFFEISVPNLNEVKAALVLAALRSTNGDVPKVAELLEITTATVYAWCDKYFGGIKNADI